MSIKRPISLTNLPPFLFQNHEVQDNDAIHRGVHDKEPTDAKGDVLKGESKNKGPGPSNQKCSRQVLNAWQCTVCRMEFKKKVAAKKHFCGHNYTGRRRKGTCLICHGSYSRAIFKHMKTHDINSVIKCILCEKAFSSTKARSRHIKTHYEDLASQCITLGMPFQDLVWFCRHSEGDIIECETCHQKYDYICNFFSHPCILRIKSKETLPIPP